MKLKKLLKHIYISYFSQQRKLYREENRIQKLGRYRFDESNFFGDIISFCDGVTFLSGGKEILHNEVYKFDSKTETPFIIDCGSNIGLSIIYFKKIYPNSIIYSFEPDPVIFEVLKKNMKRFGFKGVKIEQKAIWINNDGIEFSSEGGFSGRIAYKDDSNNIIKVPSQRLKDILDKKVDLLKIDIEGAENKVFFDIESSLPNIERLFIEYHSYSTEPQLLHYILRSLNNNGFRYHLTEAYNRTQPFVDRETLAGMDLQLNIYAYRD